MDQHGALKRKDDHWTWAEEQRGAQDPTQVGQALQALEVAALRDHRAHLPRDRPRISVMVSPTRVEYAPSPEECAWMDHWLALPKP